MATLTLTFDDDFIAQIQAYTERTGIDLATLFADAVRPIVTPERQRRPLSPDILALAGCITLPPDFDHKKAMSDWLSEDYERSFNSPDIQALDELDNATQTGT